MANTQQEAKHFGSERSTVLADQVSLPLLSSKQRTDVHRPSAIVPADYEYVSIEFMKIESFGDCIVIDQARARVKAHMARTGGTYSKHEHGGNCHVCGAGCIYTVLFYHAKSNSYIRTGNDCADKLDMAFDQNAFKRFVEGVKGAREAQAGKAKAQVLLADHGIAAAWDIYTASMPDMQHTNECATSIAQDYCNCSQASINRDMPYNRYEETTVRDIVGKTVRFGNISDKQAGFVKSLLSKIENRAALAAQRAAESEAAAPCPIGRVIITGRVLTVKTVERPTYHYGDDGMSTKILVQDLSGFKVWGNIFRNAQKGDLVTFTATVKPSDKDTKFGFYSRATKASFVKEDTGEIIPDYPQHDDVTEDLAAKQASWCQLYGEIK